MIHPTVHPNCAKHVPKNTPNRNPEKIVTGVDGIMKQTQRTFTEKIINAAKKEFMFWTE
jgi:hypothetical protein